MGKKINVGILFGGKSAEHEVSLSSAKNVISALNHDKYSPISLKIEKEGDIFPILDQIKLCDVIFPVLHGPFGEDGSIQGFLKTINKPFVGSGVLGSAIGMDKDVLKRLLIQADVPIIDYLCVTNKKEVTYKYIAEILGGILFVKPANMGSSIGVSRVTNEKEFNEAVSHAFSYDKKIIIEKGLKIREIECSVLGNENPNVSLPGEIIINKGFYSYDEKYSSDSTSVIQIPANLSESQIELIQKLATMSFQALECEGMARVDFFIDKTSDEIFVNEINTIPGFTDISMYPKMWEASGISYTDLVDKLISLAMEKFNSEKNLKTSL